MWGEGECVGVGGACSEWVWGWVEHVGVSECAVCVKCVGEGGASESGWSMWGWVEETVEME